jgi:hypothetical protein
VLWRLGSRGNVAGVAILDFGYQIMSSWEKNEVSGRKTEGIPTASSRDIVRLGSPRRYTFFNRFICIKRPSEYPADHDTRRVVNHNPLPEITHEGFVSLLGPLLAPENYLYSPPPFSPPPPPATHSSPRPMSLPALPRASTQVIYNPNSPAPPTGCTLRADRSRRHQAISLVSTDSHATEMEKSLRLQR